MDTKIISTTKFENRDMHVFSDKVVTDILRRTCERRILSKITKHIKHSFDPITSTLESSIDLTDVMKELNQ
jgi:hypothetical protein